MLLFLSAFLLYALVAFPVTSVAAPRLVPLVPYAPAVELYQSLDARQRSLVAVGLSLLAYPLCGAFSYLLAALFMPLLFFTLLWASAQRYDFSRSTVTSLISQYAPLLHSAHLQASVMIQSLELPSIASGSDAVPSSSASASKAKRDE